MVESQSIKSFEDLPSVQALKKHYNETLKSQHLRDLLKDEKRNHHLQTILPKEIVLDFAHTKIDIQGFDLL